MNRWSMRISYLLLLPFLLLPACATKQTVVSVTPEDGTALVLIEARSFSFIPTVIRARQGDHLLLRVINLANTAHNLTVKNPSGEIVQGVDLPAGQTVEIPVHLNEAGTWPYYCDRPLHTPLGMNGTIEASPGP